MSEYLKIIIHGHNLPGIRFEDLHDHDVKEPVYVGIRKNKKTIEPHPADLKEVQFEAEVKVGKSKDGSPNFLGPYVEGKVGERFLCLSWFIGADTLNAQRFRGTKIMLDHLTWDTIAFAMKNDEPIIVEIDLTASDGGPLCARARETHVKWLLK
ncbi:DUF5990 family protein [Rubellicoccus peritrichatus]|uniref:DUF5990 family protein n=1 Tax=Rubellicoccus peritrichatus TaxID=3080537 RepID=A0AAQ3LCC6_9BACT|nr:DUF5990 family protein [Puniceicoccus sp. CR14]WOO43070.1 DUF5990 family protein [Puniceicoccus sp. CR14]